MKIIAHRGNLTGPNPLKENSPDYIEEAISEGFDVEIDLRIVDNEFHLGHDDPKNHYTFGCPYYKTSIDWLTQHKDKLWIHCKNLQALEIMSQSSENFNYFWHTTDLYTITSHGIGWVYPGNYPYSKSVIVLPESISLYYPPHGYEYIFNSYGICTDKPIFYRNELEVKK